MSTKISELTAATALTGAEAVPIVQGGTTKSATVTLLRGLPGGSVATDGTLLSSRGIASVVKGGTGEYTITLSVAPATGVLFVSPTEVGIPTQDGPVTGTSVSVATFNAAGVAADVGFNFYVLDLG